MKVAVIGANGQLGADALAAFSANGDETIGLTHADIEVSSVDSVAECLRAVRPRLVVNTAAMHQLDACEDAPESAYEVNARGAQNVATVCTDLRATLMHISTDYVFDG